MSVDSYDKEKLGVSDLLFDDAGINQTSSVKVSDEGTRTVKHINAGDVPILAATRLLKYADQATPTSKNDIDVDAVLAEILANLTLIGLPSSTYFDINVSTGELTIKASSIGTSNIADLAVSTAKIAASAVTTAKINADAVDGTKIADDAVDSEHIAAGAIDNEHFAINTVGIDELNMDDAGGTFSHFIYAAGTDSPSAAAASFDIAVSGGGLVASDIVQVWFQTNANSRYVLTTAYKDANNIAVTTDLAVSLADVMFYQVLRATTAVT